MVVYALDTHTQPNVNPLYMHTYSINLTTSSDPSHIRHTRRSLSRPRLSPPSAPVLPSDFLYFYYRPERLAERGAFWPTIPVSLSGFQKDSVCTRSALQIHAVLTRAYFLHFDLAMTVASAAKRAMCVKVDLSEVFGVRRKTMCDLWKPLKDRYWVSRL